MRHCADGCDNGRRGVGEDRLSTANAVPIGLWGTFPRVGYQGRNGSFAYRLREGSYFPSLLEPRRRSEKALLAVIQQAYVEGVSTRRVDDLVKALGCEGISKSQVSRICGELDRVVDSFLETACRRSVLLPMAGRAAKVSNVSWLWRQR